MPVPNGKIETNSNCKKQRRWSLIGILSKKMKLKKSQESVDFCPYDGRINRKAMRNDRSDAGGSTADSCIVQYACSPRLIRRCNSLQCATSPQVRYAYSNTFSQPALNEWTLSRQSVYGSGSSACFSDIGGACKSYENGNRSPSPSPSSSSSSSSSSYYYNVRDGENERESQNVVPFGHCQNNEITNRRDQPARKLIGKKIPPPPPPRDPNIKAVYYIRNNRLLSRESDSTYFSQGSDDCSVADDDAYEDCNNAGHRSRPNETGKEPPRSRRPIQMGDVETLSTECENAGPRVQTAEEAIRELEDIYNSLGLSDEDLLDRAERRDLPTCHQNLRYERSDEPDCAQTPLRRRRVLPKTRRAGVPDAIFDDMAYRKLNKSAETRRKSCSAPGGSFLLVLPTVCNVDDKRPPGEPDVTLDDVVFRSRRQRLNALKVADPQPPFGIPLGPIVAAAPSDYLHAVPDARRYRSSFRPGKMPDTVEDDLAFRALRRDHAAYKTCVDFSFVRGNRFVTPRERAAGHRIKNDAHWIVKTERSGGENRPVELVLDSRRRRLGDSTAEQLRRHGLRMLVEIDRPIALTAGRFGGSVNRSSKSFFCTDLSPPRELRGLTNGAAARALTAERSPRLSYDGLTLLYLVDDDDDGGGGGVGKNRIPAEFQPNFRALIRREHARIRRSSSPSSGNVANSAIADSQNEIIETRRSFADDDAAVRPNAADVTAAKERDEEDPSPPDRGMPGYLEVCLYITIYVYQLFSVNAYSTFIALIFLVALHVCRRLS